MRPLLLPPSFALSARLATGRRVFIAALIVALIQTFSCHRTITHSDNQVVILGFDGADPKLLSAWMAAGKLPNLHRLSQQGTFCPLGTTNPPESPVAWATFATGLNPGGTGIFDFVERDPSTYLPRLALVSRMSPRLLFGLIPLPPPKVTNQRGGVSFYKTAADAGYKVTLIRMPLEFPAPRLPRGKVWSGLGVPDVRGTMGTFSYFASDLSEWDADSGETEGKLVRVELTGNHGSAVIEGPDGSATGSSRSTSVPVDFEIPPDGNRVTIQLGNRAETVPAGHWSGWFHLKFRITPFYSVHAVSRFYVNQVSPNLRLYMTPLNIDPESPSVPISYPDDYSARISREHGIFKTLGWWSDTQALNNERLDEAAFLDDLMATEEAQAQVTLDELRTDPPDLLVSIFTGTDRASHMFFRLLDSAHPAYDPVLAKLFGNAILRVYQQMDQIAGEVERVMKVGGTLMIVSDHGFHTWRKGFNTNTWLVMNGFMTLTRPPNNGEIFDQGNFFPNVDWSRTRAYALGLGQIYVNLRGREKFGIVESNTQATPLLREIRESLLAYRDPYTGDTVIQNAHLAAEIFHGPRTSRAPDLQINFRDGYRTSWQTPLGAIPRDILVLNTRKWSGDHCASDPADTPGIFLSNRQLTTAGPAIADVAPTVFGLLHLSVPADIDGHTLEFGPR